MNKYQITKNIDDCLVRALDKQDFKTAREIIGYHLQDPFDTYTVLRGAYGHVVDHATKRIKQIQRLEQLSKLPESKSSLHRRNPKIKLPDQIYSYVLEIKTADGDASLILKDFRDFFLPVRTKNRYELKNSNLLNLRTSETEFKTYLGEDFLNIETRGIKKARCLGWYMKDLHSKEKSASKYLQGKYKHYNQTHQLCANQKTNLFSSIASNLQKPKRSN